ncbi:MAG: replicative DNA helicase [Sedimentisphaerales bacterium]|jgi:replicative DNA helicase
MTPKDKQNRNNKAQSVRKTDSSSLQLGGRTMPESLEAEAAVLGSMILDPECIGQVVQQVTTGAFYRIEHQMIFDAIVSLWEKKNEKFDLLLLRDELKNRSQLEEAGGAEYLVKIAESVPSSANVEQYLQIVKDKQMMRELISAAGEVLTEAFETAGDAAEKLDRAEQKIFNVTQKKITGSAVSIKQLLTEAFEAIDRREGHHITGLPTGFAEIDDLTCGLQNGEMIVIAGRPSMGKTSFAMNIAEHIGADNNISVAFFSLEMSRQQLAERMLCSRAMMDSQIVRKGMINDNQYQELVHAASELSEKPIFVDDTPGITPLELRGKARRLRSRYGIKCVFIDYLQLMSQGGKVESRQQEVSEISRYLKALARELEIPVIVLSQLNRSPEGREGHRPRMSDLRESGSIEQDADVVVLLHREDYYHRGEQDYQETNSAEIIIAKQRNGPTDTIELNFNGTFTRFGNKTRVQEPF